MRKASLLIRRATPLLAALLVSYGCAKDAPIRGFRTDGCSWFPDGTPGDRERWKHCCVAHDRAYWRGGSCAERHAANDRFRECVAEAHNGALGWTLYVGVTAGGSAWWPTYFRWGYGWPYGRGYRELDADEARMASETLERYDAPRRRESDDDDPQQPPDVD